MPEQRLVRRLCEVCGRRIPERGLRACPTHGLVEILPTPLAAVQVLPGNATLREMRTSLGITLASAAELAKIDKAHLSRVERGQKSLSVDALVRLLRVLEQDLIADVLSNIMRGA